MNLLRTDGLGEAHDRLRHPGGTGQHDLALRALPDALARAEERAIP